TVGGVDLANSAPRAEAARPPDMQVQRRGDIRARLAVSALSPLRAARTDPVKDLVRSIDPGRTQLDGVIASPRVAVGERRGEPVRRPDLDVHVDGVAGEERVVPE